MEISNPDTGQTRWQASPRTSGHKLDTVVVDDNAYLMGHDALGRVTQGLDLDLTWGPQGRLVTAEDTSQTKPDEYYVYDADGRLAGLFDEYGRKDRLVYDGEQVVAAYDITDQLKWEAVWGPGLDQLVEWESYENGERVYVPLTDERGSVVATFDSDLMEVDQLAKYDPHGRLALLWLFVQKRVKMDSSSSTVTYSTPSLRKISQRLVRRRSAARSAMKSGAKDTTSISSPQCTSPAASSSINKSGLLWV